MYDPEKVRVKNIESEYDYWAEEAKYLKMQELTLL